MYPSRKNLANREGTCVSENCDHFFYNFCNPSALPASATAGAPACQKIACKGRGTKKVGNEMHAIF